MSSRPVHPAEVRRAEVRPEEVRLAEICILHQTFATFKTPYFRPSGYDAKLTRCATVRAAIVSWVRLIRLGSADIIDFSFPIRNCHGWRGHGHLKIGKRYGIFLNPVNCRMRRHPGPPVAGTTSHNIWPPGASFQKRRFPAPLTFSRQPERR